MMIPIARSLVMMGKCKLIMIDLLLVPTFNRPSYVLFGERILWFEILYAGFRSRKLKYNSTINSNCFGRCIYISRKSRVDGPYLLASV